MSNKIKPAALKFEKICLLRYVRGPPIKFVAQGPRTLNSGLGMAGYVPPQTGLYLLPFAFFRWAHVYLFVPLYVNRFIKKYFPIKTLSKMMDSSVKNLEKFEYDKQYGLQRQKI